MVPSPQKLLPSHAGSQVHAHLAPRFCLHTSITLSYEQVEASLLEVTHEGGTVVVSKSHPVGQPWFADPDAVGRHMLQHVGLHTVHPEVVVVKVLVIETPSLV